MTPNEMSNLYFPGESKPHIYWEGKQWVCSMENNGCEGFGSTPNRAWHNFYLNLVSD